MEYQFKEVFNELKSIIDNCSKTNPWLDISKAESYTSLSESTIRRAVKRGTLKVSKVTGKLLFKSEWLDRWLCG